jgi:hypothetical protein
MRKARLRDQLQLRREDGRPLTGTFLPACPIHAAARLFTIWWAFYQIRRPLLHSLWSDA